jgi:hypothetical protein
MEIGGCLVFSKLLGVRFSRLVVFSSLSGNWWMSGFLILTVKKSFGFKFGCKKVNVKFLWKLVDVRFSVRFSVDVRFSVFWWEIGGCPVFCVVYVRFSVLTACAQTRIHVLITVVSIFRDL